MLENFRFFQSDILQDVYKRQALGEGAAGSAVQVDGPGVLVGVSQGLTHGVEQLLAGDLAVQDVVGLVGGNHDLLTLVVPGARCV